MSCRVYGNVSSVFTGAKEGVQITIDFTQRNEYSDTVNNIYKVLLPDSTSVTSGPNGEWEVTLYDNENMVKPGFYKFTFTYNGVEYVWEKYVPNVSEAEFTTLFTMG